MLKGLGITALIITCWGTGIYLGWRLKERRARLAAICLFIGELSDRIRTGAEIGEIISDIGQPAGIAYKDLTPTFEPSFLTASDKKLLVEFLKGIGLGDTESQTQRCGVYAELFGRLEETAAHQAKEKSGLYGKLGIFSGLFIAVILV